MQPSPDTTIHMCTPRTRQQQKLKSKGLLPSSHWPSLKQAQHTPMLTNERTNEPSLKQHAHAASQPLLGRLKERQPRTVTKKLWNWTYLGWTHDIICNRHYVLISFPPKDWLVWNGRRVPGFMGYPISRFKANQPICSDAESGVNSTSCARSTMWYYIGTDMEV